MIWLPFIKKAMGREGVSALRKSQKFYFLKIVNKMYWSIKIPLKGGGGKNLDKFCLIKIQKLYLLKICLNFA